MALNNEEIRLKKAGVQFPELFPDFTKTNFEKNSKDGSLSNDNFEN